jgi:hypothetical protein
MKSDNLKDQYLNAAAAHSVYAGKEDKVLLYLSLLRFICFAGGLILTIFIFLNHQGIGMLVGAAVLILFLYLLKAYSEHSTKKEFFEALALINKREADALSGDYSVFNPGENYIDPDHDFSRDVDLFGQNSLFQYLNRTVTGYGRDILAGWLSDPFSIAGELSKRQEIIMELAKCQQWRHAFMASGIRVPLEEGDISGLLRWLKEEPGIRSSKAVRILLWLLPGLALLSLILLTAGAIHYSVFILVLLVNLSYVTVGLKNTNRIHQGLSGKYSYLSSMNRLLSVFGKGEFQSVYLNEIKYGISGDKESAAVSVKKLGRLIQSFDSRLNLLVGFFLNAMLLWDYHCINRLDKWKEEYREKFPLWLNILAEIDAYTSLAGYAFNNPGFTWPVKSDSGVMFASKDLGHPLIDERSRVTNDFYLDESGMICIVTGANMAGKSTFLRTVAVNYILAMTGSPVCATELVFTPVKLFTSMRTTDSLSGHESYFYAELKRLRQLKTHLENGDPVFFILDEILKGTNSADKALGSGLFIRKLIHLEGTGLIATHDISIGEMENEYPGKIMNMCFEIEIDGENILFDYKLVPGITRKMNAALLMKQMGILE